MGRPKGRYDRDSNVSNFTPEDKEKLKTPFFKNGEDRKNNLPDERWVVEIPEHFGKKFKTSDLSVTQLRNFYQETRRIWDLTREFGKPGSAHDGDQSARFRRGKVQLKLLAAKASYHSGRSDSKVKEVFKEYLIHCVEKVEMPEDFKVFMLSFEATVGYFYGFGGERNK